MKKVIYHPLMVLIAMAIGMSVTACDSDDNNGNELVSGKGAIEKVVMNYTVNISEDYLELFDVEVSYTDASARAVTRFITEETTEIDEIAQGLDVYPTECVFRVVANPKSAIPVIDDERLYTLKYSCVCTVDVFRSGAAEAESVAPGIVKSALKRVKGADIMPYVIDSHKLCDQSYDIPAE